MLVLQGPAPQPPPTSTTRTTISGTIPSTHPAMATTSRTAHCSPSIHWMVLEAIGKAHQDIPPIWGREVGRSSGPMALQVPWVWTLIRQSSMTLSLMIRILNSCKMAHPASTHHLSLPPCLARAARASLRSQMNLEMRSLWKKLHLLSQKMAPASWAAWSWRAHSQV